MTLPILLKESIHCGLILDYPGTSCGQNYDWNAQDWKQAVGDWHSEVKNHHMNSDNRGKLINHYLQVNNLVLEGACQERKKGQLEGVREERRRQEKKH